MIETTYLYHHGIEGMKWGKRNGPPYPLQPGDYSAAERRKMGRKNSSVLNNLDKKKAMAIGNYSEASREYNRLNKKIEKKEAKGKTVSNKLQKNRDKWNEEFINSGKEIKTIEKKTSSLIKEMEQRGYTVQQSRKMRSTLDGRDRVVNALTAIGQITLRAAGYSSLGIYKYGKVAGTKYKVR